MLFRIVHICGQDHIDANLEIWYEHNWFHGLAWLNWNENHMTFCQIETENISSDVFNSLLFIRNKIYFNCLIISNKCIFIEEYKKGNLQLKYAIKCFSNPANKEYGMKNHSIRWGFYYMNLCSNISNASIFKCFASLLHTLPNN